MKRFTHHVLLSLALYACYLAALGPYSALEGSGALNSIPRSLREACWFPSIPIWLIRGVRCDYDEYLNWWYRDPNAADPPHDW